MTVHAEYDAMCRAIDAVYKADEVKDNRDKAAAIEHYARQAHNPEAERKACEFRLRAERKAGELLEPMEKAKAGRPPKKFLGRYEGFPAGTYLARLRNHP